MWYAIVYKLMLPTSVLLVRAIADVIKHRMEINIIIT